jgi:predicted Zn-dependent peptidase
VSTTDLKNLAQRPGSTRALLGPGADSGGVRRTVLPGGLRIITEEMPSVRSTTFGIWVGVGSRDETASLAGATHYLEHLLFKGTRRRDAFGISAALEAVGGDLNAFTGKEYTCYHARVLDADLPLAVDVIVDMVTSSLISSADVEAERDVILEEIAMNEDDPSDAAQEAFAGALFGDSPLGRPILGTVDSIRSLTRSAITGYYRRRYVARNIVVTAAGNLTHRQVVRAVERAFRVAGALGVDGTAPAPIRTGTARFHPKGSIRVVHRPTEQANLVLGMPGLARTDARRFSFGVLNSALGGGMSSRLFQEVREKRGLAYSVYSFSSQYADLGVFGIYAGCLPQKTDEVLEICRGELAQVAADGITAEELRRGIGQLKGAYVLGMEDTGQRMSRLGKAELAYGELLSVDEVLRRIDAVTLEDVAAVAAELLVAPQTLAVVGPFEPDRDFAAAVA